MKLKALECGVIT